LRAARRVETETKEARTPCVEYAHEAAIVELVAYVVLDDMQRTLLQDFLMQCVDQRL
jgi:hypothetical protein